MEAGAIGPRATSPRQGIVLAISLTGLAPFVLWFALADQARLLEPLTIILAAASVASNLLEVRLDGSLWLSASFVCCLMAAAFLGPAAAFAVALVGELGAWAVVRFRWAPLAANCFGVVAPTMLAAAALDSFAPSSARHDLGFDAVLAVTASLALGLNVLIVPSLMAFHDRRPLFSPMGAYRGLVPLLGANVAFLVLLTEAYRRIGIAASVFLIVLVLAFSYVLRLLVTAKQRARRVEDLSASRGNLVAQALNAEDRERRRLAEQIHDEAVQNLLAARQEIEEAEQGDKASLPRAQAAIEETVRQLRDTVFDLHPAVLEHGGLAPALKAIVKQQARRGGFRAHLEVDPAATGIEDQLIYSLCRELLINAARHAEARQVELSVRRQLETIEIKIRDDGKGFDRSQREAAVSSGHIGLASSSERIEAVGGALRISSSPGAGTTIRITLPLSGEPAREPDRIQA